MKLALKEAKKALKNGDVPVGAVIVKNNEVIAKACNKKERRQVATYHAEMLAIDKACRKLKSFRLHEASMYVTLEPCMMCMGAILSARIKRLYIGVMDENLGFAGGKFDGTSGYGYSLEVLSGIGAEESKSLLDEFFVSLREKNKLKKLIGTTQTVFSENKKNYILIEKKKIEVFLNPSNNTREYLVVGAVQNITNNEIFLVLSSIKIDDPDEIYRMVKDMLQNKVAKIFTMGNKVKIYGT